MVHSFQTLTTFQSPVHLPIFNPSWTLPTSTTLQWSANIMSDYGMDGADEARGTKYTITQWTDKGPLDMVLAWGGPVLPMLQVWS